MSENSTEAAPEQQQEAGAGEQQEAKTYSEDYVKKLRDESANYRTKLREAEEAQADAQKLQDELNAAKEERDSYLGDLSKYKEREQVRDWSQEIAKDSHISADLLRGSTKEELQEHFEQLKKQFPLNENTPRVTLPGEGESTPLALNGDGIENALKGALNIR